MNAAAPTPEGIKVSTAKMAVTSFEKVILDFSRESGRPLSVDLVRSSLPEGREMATLEDLSDVSRICGIHAQQLQVKPINLTDDQCPALIQYDEDKYVVVMRIGQVGEADVLESDGVKEGLLLEEQVWTYQTQSVHQLTIESQHAVMRWSWLLRPLQESKAAYGQVILAAVLINFLALTTSIFTMVVYDRVLPNGATESLVALTIGVGIALVFDIIIKMLRGWFLDGAGSRADTRIGEKLFEQLIAIDLSARKDSVGGLSSIMREFETLRDFMTSATLVTLIDLPFIIIFLSVIYALGGAVVLVPAILVPLVILVGVIAQPFLARLANESIEEGKNKQSILVESISGIEVLKTSMAGREMRKRWRESLVQQSSSSVKSKLVSQLVVNFSAFAQQAAQVGIVVVGAYQVSAGNLTMGGLIASVILAGRTMAPLSQIANVLTRLVSAKASFKALDEFMSLPLDRPPQARFLTKEKMVGQIEFRHANFSYPDQEQAALADVTFSIKPGEKVALLGKIGSGKSTVARLLTGLYSPNSGSVLIDDTDVRQLDPFDLRRNVSVVMQDSWLFSGSVRDNIASGSVAVTDDDLLKAAEISGVHDFLGGHPKGYDLMIRERGEGLSGGQRQAINVARGLVGNAPILIMDEPTSMMDTGSETKLVNRLKDYVQDKTLIMITHRNAMLHLVDRVIIFDQGKIVADGPKSMLSKGPAAKATVPKSGAKPRA